VEAIEHEWQLTTADPPVGRYFALEAMQKHVWFSVDHWLHHKYHTLLLYTFSSADFPGLMFFAYTAHIVPNMGLVSFWIAFFSGNIGGALGILSEYYYCHHQLHVDRATRREKFSVAQITESYKDASPEDWEKPSKNRSYNPHDFIDATLLDKLFYSSNAHQTHFGPEMSMHGLIGFSWMLSLHALYKQMKKYTRRRLYEDETETDIAIDGEEYTMDERNNKNWWSVLGTYRSEVVTGLHCVLFAWNTVYIASRVKYYALQSEQKQKDFGGYQHMSAGKGVFGESFASLTSLVAGMLMYPLTIKRK